MAKGFKHGGGGGGGGGGAAGLNFQVLGGTAEPTSARENDVWVKTAVSIPDWIISPVDPASSGVTAAGGMVWIQTTNKDGLSFNVLKKNHLYVFPVSCKQYVDGAWANVEAYVCKDGSWEQFSAIITDVYLYNQGDTCDSITGGWDCSVENSEKLDLTAWSNTWAYGQTANTKAAIDLTDFNTLLVTVDTYFYTGVCAIREDAASSTNIASVTINGVNTFALDVSGISGAYYVCLESTGKQTDGGSIGFTVTQVQLTK